MIYDVDIVAVPEQAVLALRAEGPLRDIGRRTRLVRELAAQAGLTPAGPPMARFYAQGGAGTTVISGDTNQGFDVALPVSPRPDGSVPDRVGEARGELIPLHHVMQATHLGPHDTMQDAWRAVFEAAGALGYSQAGPVTEIYVKDRPAVTSPDDFVTLVRLPYAR